MSFFSTMPVKHFDYTWVWEKETGTLCFTLDTGLSRYEAQLADTIVGLQQAFNAFDIGETEFMSIKEVSCNSVSLEARLFMVLLKPTAS